MDEEDDVCGEDDSICDSRSIAGTWERLVVVVVQA